MQHSVSGFTSIPFENGKYTFKEAQKRKQIKYEYLKGVLKKRRIRSVTVDVFIVCSLGDWDPDNVDILKLFTSRHCSVWGSEG